MFFKKKNDRDFTIGKICSKFGVSVPSNVGQIADEINNNIYMDIEKIPEGCIFILSNDSFDLVETITAAEAAGATVFFADSTKASKVNPDNFSIPIIFVDDLVQKVSKMYAEIRQRYDLKTVAITGTVGKTTTKEFIRLAAAEKYNIYYSKRNNNTFRSITRNIMTRLSSEQQVYIQEVGADLKGSVRLCGGMLEADIFVLTNVHGHHLNEYGTYENLFEDKLSIQDYMKADGVIVANFDDVGISKADFKRRVVSVGIDTALEVDYRGINIVQNNEILEMDIVYQGQRKHFKIRAIGEHNAYNVLEAFAVARELKVADDVAVKAIEKFRSNGLRQNFKNIGGYKLYIDCYNVCAASIEAGLKTMEQFKLEDGCRKIAIIGGENKLGPNVSETTYQLGRHLAKSKIDHIICFGSEGTSLQDLDVYGDGRALLKGLKDGGFENAEFIFDRKQLVERIGQLAHQGDLLFFKGIWLLDMAQIIDTAFGSSFAFDYAYYSANGELFRDNNFTGKLIRNMEALELTEYAGGSAENVVIPDEIQGHKIFRIGNDLFSGDNSLRTLELGNTVESIGSGAFSQCTNLERVEIPPSVKIIFRNAFKGCTSLKEVVFHPGLTHIGPGAFSGCPNLKGVELPETVGYKAKSAF